MVFRKRDNKSVNVVSHETFSVCVALCVRELRRVLKFARERTFGRHWPHFHLHTVRQARAFPCDSQRIIEAGHIAQLHAFDRGLDLRAIPLFIERKVPLRPASALPSRSRSP